jgi:hypothetical protein
MGINLYTILYIFFFIYHFYMLNINEIESEWIFRVHQISSLIGVVGGMVQTIFSDPLIISLFFLWQSAPRAIPLSPLNLLIYCLLTFSRLQCYSLNINQSIKNIWFWFTGKERYSIFRRIKRNRSWWPWKF